MIKEIIRKLIRIYTPFVCAVIVVLNGVLYFSGYKGLLYRIFSEFTGHSFLVVAYMLACSSAMCKWYKITCWLLFASHIPNLMKYYGMLEMAHAYYLTVLVNVVSLITYLIYRIKVGITKFLC